MNDRFGVVRAWLDAVNMGDADKLVALSTVEIEIGGPRGSTSGNERLRDWLVRSGIQLEPRRWFAGQDDLVVEQIATWRTSEEGVTEPVTIASAFRVEDGRVSRMVRFSSLEDALAATELTEQDEESQAAR